MFFVLGGSRALGLTRDAVMHSYDECIGPVCAVETRKPPITQIICY